MAALLSTDLKAAAAAWALTKLHEEQGRQREQARRLYATVQCPPPKAPDPVCEDGLIEFTVEFN
jgi:hypothetical protein